MEAELNSILERYENSPRGGSLFEDVTKWMLTNAPSVILSGVTVNKAALVAVRTALYTLLACKEDKLSPELCKWIRDQLIPGILGTGCTEQIEKEIASLASNLLAGKDAC